MATGTRKPRKRPRRGARQLVDVRSYASDHPDYVQCRLWAHPWNLSGAIEYRNGSVVWPLECGRCGATQDLHTDRHTGDIDKRTYRHGEGYLWEGVGQQKPKAGELRVALVSVLRKGRGI